MRIVHLHDEPWDSGIAHYAVTLAAAQRDAGHDVRFWCRAGSPAAGQARALGLSPRELAQPWVSLPGLRAELSERAADVLNAHTGSAHSLAAALAAATQARVVRTRGDARPPARHFLAQALARRTAVFVAANRALRDELCAAFPEARVELVFQGIAELGTATPLRGLSAVGLLGRLDAVKGHETFIAAAARLTRDFPSVEFLAAGADASGRLAELERRAEGLGLDGRFRFLGRVPSAAEFINRCGVGVVASSGSEAVSRAALEWMQLGRPVVATRVGCLPDLVEDGRTGLLVAPEDPEALAGALKRLLCDPAEAGEMGRRGRARFEAGFSLERFVCETDRVYRSVLS